MAKKDDLVTVNVKGCIGSISPEVLGANPRYSFDCAKFLKLAELKEKIKTLEGEASTISAELLGTYPELKKVEIPILSGTFTKASRETWELIDAKKLLAKVGEKVFMGLVKVGKTDCSKAVGEVGFANLVKAKVFKLTGTSEGFTWRTKKDKD